MPHLILRIDLTRRDYVIEELPKDIIRKYIGGRGLGAYLLYKSVPENTDPQGEENHIIFTAGPASGTGLFYSSKINVTTKSPLTNVYLYSISSGILAAQMKKAGYWAIDVTGIAESPIYLSIENEMVKFKNAGSLWGMEPAAAQRAMLGDLADKKAATTAIGPAGEKRIRYASLFSGGDLYRCFGRGGTGCVMGSKRLSKEISGSEHIAMHSKGMEFGGYECRGLNGQALQFAIDNRGGCHHGYGLPARLEIFDGSRLTVKGKGEQVKQAAISRIIRDCLILCTFTPVHSNPMIAEMLSALSEETWTTDDIQEAGTRIMCQERLFNMREGVTRKDDSLPGRLLNEPKPDGPTKGAVVPLEALKDDFYNTMEYDLETGNPTDARLTRLGIET